MFRYFTYLIFIFSVNLFSLDRIIIAKNIITLDDQHPNANALYIKENRFSLLTSRFNEKTWNENQKYRLKKEIGCIYCSPCPIANEIPLDSIMFILEMNNDKNRIEGINLVW